MCFVGFLQLYMCSFRWIYCIQQLTGQCWLYVISIIFTQYKWRQFASCQLKSFCAVQNICSDSALVSASSSMHRYYQYHYACLHLRSANCLQLAVLQVHHSTLTAVAFASVYLSVTGTKSNFNNVTVPVVSWLQSSLQFVMHCSSNSHFHATVRAPLSNHW